MKRASLSILLCILVMLTTVHNASASSDLNIHSDPKFYLEDYLNAVKDKNLDRMMDLTHDYRFSNLDDKKDLYQRSLSSDREGITDYEITDSEQIKNEATKFSVRIYFENGAISEAPFVVDNIEGEMRVVIESPHTINDDILEIQKAPDNDELESSVVPQNNTDTITIQATRCTWNFSGRVDGRSFDSICSFDINTTDSEVVINYRQWNDNGLGIDNTVRYEIRNNTWLGSEQWGYTDAWGQNKDKGKQLTIHGKTTKVEDAYMRFTVNEVDDKVVTYAGFGELYD
ncbi:hypothetical protein [Paenibacillus sp. W2I17]|uniref:hypothetical protein n=1 Tax=Paenibacillus sp. W2I17 TaxID=3042311 RepID=UPI002782AFFF|nr:hypothetical protein [Paenibacillus sp. W2I17]MDQ0659214.1 beta2-toxin [Paenibacillus sp. W2I17]